jgi:hypothetical protein
MKRVYICSPLAAPDQDGIESNRLYALKCVWHSIRRGEAPYAPHLFLTGSMLLNDLIPGDRALGITIGNAWGDWSDLIAVYTDRGISKGMQSEIDRFRHRCMPLEMRSLDDNSQPQEA